MLEKFPKSQVDPKNPKIWGKIPSSGGFKSEETSVVTDEIFLSSSKNLADSDSQTLTSADLFVSNDKTPVSCVTFLMTSKRNNLMQ